MTFRDNFGICAGMSACRAGQEVSAFHGKFDNEATLNLFGNLDKCNGERRQIIGCSRIQNVELL